MPAQPQDRRVKKTEGFRFTGADGESHVLPPASVGHAHLTGRDVRDAAMGGEVGQLAYMFKLLEAAGVDEAALNALYDLPESDMLQVLEEWGEYGDGDGASLGE